MTGKGTSKRNDDARLVADAGRGALQIVANTIESIVVWWIFTPFLLYLSGYLIHRLYFGLSDTPEGIPLLHTFGVVSGIFYFSHRALLPFVSSDPDFTFLDDMRETIKLQLFLASVICTGVVMRGNVLQLLLGEWSARFKTGLLNFWVFYLVFIGVFRLILGSISKR